MHNVKSYGKLAETKEGQRDASLLKFGSKQLDGGLPNEDIISPFHSPLSNAFYPLGVVEPAQKKKSSQTDKPPFRCAGKDNIHRKWTHRMASLASNIRIANSKMVNALSGQAIAITEYCLLGVPKASK